MLNSKMSFHSLPDASRTVPRAIEGNGGDEISRAYWRASAGLVELRAQPSGGYPSNLGMFGSM